MRRRRGLTLLELLIVAMILGIMMAALGRAYIATIATDQQLREGRDAVVARRDFEARIAELLTHAYLSPDTTDTTTFFVSDDTGGGAATIAFTMLGNRPPRSFLNSDDDFETLNERFGPQGGVTEVALSTIPVGNAPMNDALFLREQRPADGDPEQGGFETALWEGVTDATFEFYDGQAWVPTWDTREQTEPRLPAAVRMTYSTTEDEQDRTLVMRLPGSDVTALDPLSNTTEGQ
jgi:prepilin-type N-terminal cleavage/methylation domain-containing protein